MATPLSTPSENPERTIKAGSLVRDTIYGRYRRNLDLRTRACVLMVPSWRHLVSRLVYHPLNQIAPICTGRKFLEHSAKDVLSYPHSDRWITFRGRLVPLCVTRVPRHTSHTCPRLSFACRPVQNNKQPLNHRGLTVRSLSPTRTLPWTWTLCMHSMRCAKVASSRPDPSGPASSVSCSNKNRKTKQ